MTRGPSDSTTISVVTSSTDPPAAAGAEVVVTTTWLVIGPLDSEVGGQPVRLAVDEVGVAARVGVSSPPGGTEALTDALDPVLAVVVAGNGEPVAEQPPAATQQRRNVASGPTRRWGTPHDASAGRNVP